MLLIDDLMTCNISGFRCIGRMVFQGHEVEVVAR